MVGFRTVALDGLPWAKRKAGPVCHRRLYLSIKKYNLRLIDISPLIPLKYAMKNENRRIGRIIREVRKSRGLTQMGLSELIGVSYQQVQKYEKGVDNISIERLKQIANAVNAPMTFFFPLSEGAVKESQAAYGNMADDEVQLLQLFRRLKSKKARKAVIELLRSFTSS